MDDLHRLWWVMLKERNALLSEREFCKSRGVHWRGASQLWKVRKGMARLKTVVGERMRERAAVRAQRRETG